MNKAQQILIPWLIFFGALAIGIITFSEQIRSIQIANDVDHFRSTRAILNDQHVEKHKIFSTYHVGFEYKVKDFPYKGTNVVTKWTDREENVKDLIRKEDQGKKSILIYYDPEHPRRVVIRKEIAIWPHILIISGTILLFIFSLFGIISQQRKRLYLKKSREDFLLKKQQKDLNLSDKKED